MIYTVTFNPAIDYVVKLDSVNLGGINRFKSEDVFVGGKGINVSLVLAQLEVESKALGFVAGFTGDFIRNSMSAAGVQSDFVQLDSGFTRINVKLKAERETELNGQGPDIPEAKIEELFAKLDKLQGGDTLHEGDTLVLAGSIPASLPSNIYQRILERISGKNIRIVVDAAKDLLLNSLKYKPFLIKPNNHELSEIFGKLLTTPDEIAEHAKKLQQMGAQNVLVSMAGDGALLLDEHGDIHSCGVCSGTVRNSVGAGDSMVAGFLAGLEKGAKPDYGYALKLGTAAGGATAFSEGLARREMIEQLIKQL